MEKLDVVRGTTHALRSVSLTIPRARVTGLLGPSGSGKTTLIRSVVGVQIVRRGTVTVLGSPAGTPELRARVGYVTQAPSVYLDLTTRENLRYFGRIVGVGAARVREVLDVVGLDPVLRRDLWATFHRLADEGATLLVSSHVMDEAERCDELILIRDGSIVAQSTPEEIRRQTRQEDLEHAFLALVEAA